MATDKVQAARDKAFALMKTLPLPSFDPQALATAFIQYEAAVREDERELVERRIADALMTAERGDALLSVVRGAHVAEMELAGRIIRDA